MTDTRPTPAQMPQRRLAAVPRPVPSPRVGRRSSGLPALLGELPLPEVVLETSLTDACRQLGLSDPGVIQAAADVVGGDWRWGRFGNGSVAGLGQAWRAACDWTGPPGDPGWLLVALTVQHAFRHDLTSLAADLTRNGMNAWGTWREVNLRLAGHLYGFSLKAPEDAARSALLLALQCWTVVEAADPRLDDRKRKIWRGMRAGTRLYLGRRAEDPDVLLSGAKTDFEAAHAAGDRTSQHFALFLEALHRLWDIQGDRDDLDRAAELLTETTRLPEVGSHELLVPRGEHLLRRGMLALTADRERDAGDENPNEIGAPRLARTQLLAAHSALAASVAVFDAALTKPPAGRIPAEVVRVRRGIALGRQAQARRLLDGDDEPLLRRALEDLASGEAEDARLVAPYAATVRLHLARKLARLALPEESLAVAREGLLNWQHRRDADDQVIQGLRAAEADAAIMIATETGTRQQVHDALSSALGLPAEARQRLRIATISYAGRSLLPDPPWPPASGPSGVGGVPEAADRVLLRRTVTYLENAARDAYTGSHRQFAASHAAMLLAMTDANGPAPTCHVDVLDRVHALATVAHTAVPGHSQPVVIVLFARACLRLARCLRSEPERSGRLYQDAIDAFSHVLRLAGLADAAGRPHAPPEEAHWDFDPTREESSAVSAVPAAAAKMIDVTGPGAPASGFSSRPQGAPDPASLASLLGEAHLRLAALRRDPVGAGSAVEWLSASHDWGNDRAELLGLLGDALYRRARNPRARRETRIKDLQAALDHKRAARALQKPSRENLSVSAAASLRLWRLTGAVEHYMTAGDLALRAAETDQSWPWPVLQLADLADADAAVREAFPADSPVAGPAAAWLWSNLRDGRGSDLVERACVLAAMTEEFEQQVLGGVSRTFVLDDPHGLLNSTLVLKPATFEQANAERQSLRALQDWLDAYGAPSWAAVPVPLAVVQDPRRAEHALLVTRLAAGRVLRTVLAEAGTPQDPSREEARSVLERALTFLALILARRGDAGAGARRKWMSSILQTGPKRPPIEQLRLRRLGVRSPVDFLDSFTELVPTELPMVGKRDAHADNWIVTDGGNLVALDLLANSWLPFTAEAAQLLEDTPALDTSDAGLEVRRELLAVHVRVLTDAAPQQLGEALSRVTPMVLWRGYEAFSLLRAVFLVDRFADGGSASSSGSVRFAMERSRHGRALIDRLAVGAADARLRDLAAELRERLPPD